MSFFNKGNEKEIAVIGLGRFGGSLARRLKTLGHNVMAIDIDPRAVKDIADDVTEALVLDAMDEQALRQADITAFHTVVVAIPGDFETNALITSTLKKIGIQNVISESNSSRHQEILLRIGADRVIIPESDSGYQLADELSIPGMLDILHINPDYSLIELKPSAGLIGKTADVCEPYDVVLVLIVRGTQLIVNPEANTKIMADDILVLVGEKRRLAEFSNIK